MPLASPVAARVPSAIGSIVVTLEDNIGDENDRLLFQIQILDAAGDVLKVVPSGGPGNLAPHIDETANLAVADLNTFMSWLRNKAVTELLPA